MRIAALGLALTLGACATVTPQNITDRAREIQNYTKLACSFVPTVATIAAIVSKGSTASVAQMASDICAAVTTAPLADGGTRRAYHPSGVRIRGQFINGAKV